MKKIPLLLILISLLGGCIEYQEVKMTNIQHVKIKHIEKQNITLCADITLSNPNNYKIKVKPSDFQLLLSEANIGTIKLEKAVMLEKNSELVYAVSATVKLEGILKGGISSLMGLATKKSLQLHIKGKLKASVHGITKKIPVDKTKLFSPSDLGISPFGGF